MVHTWRHIKTDELGDPYPTHDISITPGFCGQAWSHWMPKPPMAPLDGAVAIDFLDFRGVFLNFQPQALRRLWQTMTLPTVPTG